MTPQVRPCDDAAQLQEYIDTYWRHGHVLARDADRFPAGLSVLGLYDRARLVGFLGAIVAPYPRPQSYWLALWHVLPELKGGGLGGKLLQRMQEIAEERDGWIGTFGAGPEALPVYLKRGYCVRAARRWIYGPEASTPVSLAPVLHSAECEPSPQWFDYRYHRHPVYTYDVRPRAIFRTEDNPWGRVTHACWLAVEARTEVESRLGLDAGAGGPAERVPPGRSPRQHHLRRRSAVRGRARAQRRLRPGSAECRVHHGSTRDRHRPRLTAERRDPERGGRVPARGQEKRAPQGARLFLPC
jgi:GNAT superfamily N-acetyltransferase